MTLLDPPTRCAPDAFEMPALPAVRRGDVFTRWLTPTALVVILVAFSVGLHTYFEPAIIHPDANGYWAQASLLVHTGKTWFVPQSDAQYVGMHWLVTNDGNYISRYPPGFPAGIALVMKLFGWRASLLINPVLSVIALLGVFAVTKRLASAGWGLAAVALVAINSTFAVHAVTDISHMPVACFMIWTVYALLRWSNNLHWAWLALAGVLMGGVAVTRYADVVMALGPAVFVLMHMRDMPKYWISLAAAVAGGGVVVAPMMIRNQQLLGGFWKTGYTLTNESTGFSWQNFLDHALPYLRTLQGGGLGMLFALGLVGIVGMIFTRRERATGLLMLLSAMPLLLLYMAYYWAMGINGNGGGGGAGVGGAMRFLVPLVPLFVIPGVWVLSRTMAGTPRAARGALPVLLAALHLLLFGQPLQQEMAESRDGKHILYLAANGLEKVAGAGDVIIADSNLLQNFDMLGKWKLADVSVLRGGGFGGPGGGGGPPGGGGNQRRGGMRGQGGGFGDANPTPQQAAKRLLNEKHYPGTTAQKQKKFLADVTQWAEGKAIYAVGSADDITRLLPGVPKNEIETVSRIPTPKPPAEEELMNDNGPPGMGGPGGMDGGGRGGNQRRRGGGMFGPSIPAGEDIVIVRWTPKTV